MQSYCVPASLLGPVDIPRGATPTAVVRAWIKSQTIQCQDPCPKDFVRTVESHNPPTVCVLAKRPACRCRCGCRRRPGRLIPCDLCGCLVGPGCCMVNHERGARRGNCHLCYQPEPEPGDDIEPWKHAMEPWEDLWTTTNADSPEFINISFGLRQDESGNQELTITGPAEKLNHAYHITMASLQYNVVRGSSGWTPSEEALQWNAYYLGTCQQLHTQHLYFADQKWTASGWDQQPQQNWQEQRSAQSWEQWSKLCTAFTSLSLPSSPRSTSEADAGHAWSGSSSSSSHMNCGKSKPSWVKRAAALVADHSARKGSSSSKTNSRMAKLQAKPLRWAEQQVAHHSATKGRNSKHLVQQEKTQVADPEGNGSLHKRPREIENILLATVGVEKLGLHYPRGGEANETYIKELTERIAREPNFENYDICLLNTTTFWNPHAVRHSGEHVEILEQMVRLDAFPKLLQTVKTQLKNIGKTGSRGRRMIAFVCWCRSGRHRSVGFAACLRYVFQKLGYIVPETIHLSS